MGEAVYGLRFNRIRGRGRGWLLAGFEIVVPEEPQALALPEEVAPPRFELALAADDVASDAFDRELSPRLLI